MKNKDSELRWLMATRAGRGHTEGWLAQRCALWPERPSEQRDLAQRLALREIRALLEARGWSAIHCGYDEQGDWVSAHTRVRKGTTPIDGVLLATALRREGLK